MTGILKTECECKKVQYCSIKCQKNDEKFHKGNCEFENRVDFDKI